MKNEFVTLGLFDYETWLTCSILKKKRFNYIQNTIVPH